MIIVLIVIIAGSSREGKEPYSRFHSISCGATLRLFQALNVINPQKMEPNSKLPSGLSVVCYTYCNVNNEHAQYIHY